MVRDEQASNDERRWTRGTWLTLLAVVALWVAAAGSAVAALREPTDGWLAPQGEIPPPITVFVGDWPTPLRSGDRITAVGDVSMLSEFTELGVPANPPPGWVVGGSVPYTVLRDGEQLTLDVPIGRVDNAGAVRAFVAAMAD